MKKENKEKKMKISPSRIFGNNFYMLKMVQGLSKPLIAYTVFNSALFALMSFVSDSYLMRYALNGISEKKRFESIMLWITLWFVLRISIQIFFNIFMHVKSWLMYDRVHYGINRIIYQKAKSVDLKCYENPDYYDKLNKAVSESADRATGVLNTVDSLIYYIVTFSANLGLIIAIDPRLLLFVIIPVLATFLWGKHNKLKYEQNMKTLEEKRKKDYTQRVFYLSDYAKEMRLTSIAPLMINRLKEIGKELIAITKKYGISIALIDFFITMCNELIGVVGATVYSVYHTLKTKRMGYGDCLVVINSIGGISYSITRIIKTFMEFGEHALYIENLRSFLEYEEEIKDGDESLPEGGDIVFKNVSFKYDGAENYTLRNINLTFGRNEKVAIVGHNGAGKSTIVKLLLRLYDAEGEILYSEKNIKSFRLSEYRDAFSAVMQDFHIFALTVEENVKLGRVQGEDNEKIRLALQKSGMAEKIESFEKKEKTVLAREFDSKGEQLSNNRS